MKNNSMKNEQLQIIQYLLKKDLELDASTDSLMELNNKLKSLIQHLLNNDLERLLIGFYRIDVNEKKVKEALLIESPDLIAGKLSELVIERLQQKAATRIQYR